MIPETLIRRKEKIEKEFRSYGLDAKIDVTPQLPENLNIRIRTRNVTREKTIHYNEMSLLRQMLKSYKLI